MIKCVSLPDVVSAAILVIAGFYGDGEERKKALEKAGYTYREVQDCVNALIPILNKYK